MVKYSILCVMAVILAGYALYLKISRRRLWEMLQIEKARAEWNVLYLYYLTHPERFKPTTDGDTTNVLTKEEILSEHPILHKVFRNASRDDIIASLEGKTYHLLPFYENEGRFIDEILYGGNPPVSRKIRAKR